MKRLFYLFCLIGVISCQNDNYIVNVASDNTYLNKDGLLTKVVDLSLSFCNQLNSTRGYENKVQVESVYALSRNYFFPPFRFSKEMVDNMPDTLMYVVNFADKNGFALISTNIRTFGILAYVEKGSFYPNDIINYCCPIKTENRRSRLVSN